MYFKQRILRNKMYFYYNLPFLTIDFFFLRARKMFKTVDPQTVEIDLNLHGLVFVINFILNHS